MAMAFSPATSLRFKHLSAARFITFYRKTAISIPSLQSHVKSPALYSTPFCLYPRRRSFCSIISAALSSGEATKTGTFDKKEATVGDKVGEFRKRLRIVDIKGGPDEGLNRLGETLMVRGWVRTLRMQSSVTFIEVESGVISTGASIWVQGVVVNSQGTKQKIELKIEKLAMVNNLFPSVAKYLMNFSICHYAVLYQAASAVILHPYSSVCPGNNLVMLVICSAYVYGFVKEALVFNY